MSGRAAIRILAAVLLTAGLLTFAFGDAWAPKALAWLPDNEAGVWLELLLPFLPMALIIAGAVLYRPPRGIRSKKS